MWIYIRIAVQTQVRENRCKYKQWISGSRLQTSILDPGHNLRKKIRIKIYSGKENSKTLSNLKQNL